MERYLRWWNHYSDGCGRDIADSSHWRANANDFLSEQFTICWSWGNGNVSKVEERLQAGANGRFLRVDRLTHQINGLRQVVKITLINPNRKPCIRRSYELQVSRQLAVKGNWRCAMWAIWACANWHSEEYQGSVIKVTTNGKVKCWNMVSTGNGQTRLIFLFPARGLIWYSTEFLSMTRGYRIIDHTFDPIPTSDSRWDWRSSSWSSCFDWYRKSNDLFSHVYWGAMEPFCQSRYKSLRRMIIGENSRENDDGQYYKKAKQMTNVVLQRKIKHGYKWSGARKTNQVLA